MAVPYTPLSIANEFIARHGEPYGIEHMKLQKLVYCSYGYWLGHFGIDGTRLTTESPQIWKFGPVFPSLYHAMKFFGRREIDAPQAATPFSTPDRVDPSDTGVFALIDWVWDRYGHMTSFSLSDLTHRPGTPWHRVATENEFRVQQNTPIPDEYIYEEFCRLLKEIESGDDGKNQKQAS